MNKKFKIAAAISIALNISACSEKKTVEQYLASATEFTANNNITSAIIELKNGVRLAPKNPEARFYLGKAYLEQGSYINAEKEIERAQQLGYEVASINTHLIQIKSKLNKTEEVYQLIKESTQFNDDNYIIMLTFAGITALKEGDLQKAQDYFGQAITVNKASKYSEISQAYLFQSRKEFNNALEIVEHLLAQSPDFSEALLLKAHLLFTLKQYELASKSFSQYLNQHPKADYIRFFEIDTLMKAENYSEAEKKVDEVLKIYKNSALAHQYKSQLEYQKNNYAQAKQYAELALQQDKRFAIARMVAGVSAYRLNDMEQAYTHLKPLEPFLKISHPAKKILVVIKMQLGYTDEAIESLNKLQDLTPLDSEFLQAFSVELMKAGELGAAKDILGKAQQSYPDDANIIAQKGMLLLSQKDLSGIKNLEHALKLDPELKDVELSLALQYLANNQVHKAEAIAIKWLGEDDNQLSGYLLQGIIFSKQNENEKAKTNFKKILMQEPTNVAALFNLAVLAESDSQMTEAVNYYQKLLQNQPSHEGAMKRLTELQFKNGQAVESISFLTELHEEHSDNINLSLGLAQNLRMNNQTEQAISILLKVNKDESLPSGYWVILGDSYTQLRKFDLASKTFAEAANKLPQHYLISLRQISLLEIEKKYSKALQTTKEAYRRFPDNNHLEMLLAHFELLNNNKVSAAERLAKLKIKKINHPFIDNVAGQLAMSNKNYSVAVEHFSAINQQNPSSKNIVFLAQALKFNGQQKEAEKALEVFVESNPKDDRVKMLLADLYGSDSRHKINEIYLGLLKNRPNNLVILNNLAWNQYQLGKNGDALVSIEKAYNIQPKSVLILESYGVILIANNRHEKGIDILNQALTAGSKDVSIQLSLAEGYIGKKDYQQAENILIQLSSKDEKINLKIKQLLSHLK
ncbi:MAG: PEP-CTERM system TPR-repeat protein PrsT [Colwellia sp.]|nr:PEP-CTERM system TPR-repeat protein PrsT [Colwellia sp.]